MNFFAKDYEIPSDSKYMKLEEGDNTFRILGTFSDGKAIMGTEYWKTVGEGRKPFRLPVGKPVPVAELEVNPQTGEPDRPKHFWALPVFNRRSKTVQILEITQKTIMQAIKALADNKKWGDPREYDIVVTKVVENGKTSYTVTPDPKEKLEDGIMQMYTDMHIDITALYRGDDPFAEPKVNIDDIPDNL